MWRILAWSLALAACCTGGATGAGAAEPKFELPEGFVVERFAGDELAHDIFCLTLDSHGQVVVSGPGYIKRLEDRDGDGVAESFTLVSGAIKSGAQGLCYDGTDLVFAGDGRLGRLRDGDGDGVMEGEPEVWLALRGGEHGVHAVTWGPDGQLYVMCGNESGLNAAHITDAQSPVPKPRSGAVLRISRDGRERSVVADGFRNAYDLGFAATGKILTVDSDGERVHHLPWYAPTRMFDVASGQSHGWLAGGYEQSWSRPEWFADNVERLAEFGRGSPTGLAVYRSQAFPERYREGAFCACWTLGKIYYVPLARAGASLARQKPETFLASLGSGGFAPVDLEVGTQGELWIAVGGRGTAGGVFRVRYQGAHEPVAQQEPLSEVLDAPQPLASWSRACWQPVAEQLGRESFERVVLDSEATSRRRVRAVEILVDRWGGLRREVAQGVVDDTDAEVVARAAWALGWGGESGRAEPLTRWTGHPDARVQRAAWEGLARCEVIEANPAWQRAFTSRERRVRTAARNVAKRAGRASATAWRAGLDPNRTGREELADLWLELETQEVRDLRRLLIGCCERFEQTRVAEERLEALRIAELALGDIRVEKLARAFGTGYSALHPDWVDAGLRREVGQRLAQAFPTGEWQVDLELGRVLAMFEAESTGLLERICDRWNADSPPDDDMHWLIVLARLPGPRSERVSRATAEAMAALNEKLDQRDWFVSRHWPEWGAMTLEVLIERDPSLAEHLVASERFGHLGHVDLLPLLGEAARVAGARKILATAERLNATGEESVWTAELVRSLASLPDEEWLPVLRGLDGELQVQGEVLARLAKQPVELDRARFVRGVESTQPSTVTLCAKALLKLDSQHSASEAGGAVRAMTRLASGLGVAVGETAELKQERARRKGALLAIDALLSRWSGQESGGTNDQGVDPSRWVAWLTEGFPEEAERLSQAGDSGARNWDGVPWSAGDVGRGAKVFERQQCARCHAGRKRLGPDLAGVAQRFSREDLVRAIIDPSLNVAPSYRATTIGTDAGTLHVGYVVYDSPEGLLLETAEGTVRLTEKEIISRGPSEHSFMPTGLLDALSDGDVADLFAYLGTLQ